LELRVSSLGTRPASGFGAHLAVPHVDMENPRAARSRTRAEEVSPMTAILVAFTILLFLSIDFLRSRRRRVTAPAAAPIAVRPQEFELPEGLFVGPGHTWARLEPDGSVLVGLDDFATRILGRIDRLEVAAAGAEVRHEDAAVVLHQNDKSVAFASPLEGTVTAVHTEALQRPARVHGEPYGAGWLLRLQPRQLASQLRELRLGAEARSWLQAEFARFGEYLGRQIPADAVGATARDGGVPVAGVLEHLNSTSWEQFEAEFLATR
jgi:glycine cleavage system H protein